MNAPEPRDIRQIAVADGTVVAVAHDGTVWTLELRALRKVWQQLPPLPL